jgi:hypothetical protein
MTTHPNILKVKLESVRDLKARNKEGMPYSMLFTNEASLKNHGPLYMTSMQRFDAAGAGADFALPTGRNVNERRKELKRETRRGNAPRSVYTDSNYRMDGGSSRPAMAEGPIEELPVFRRRALISGWAK